MSASDSARNASFPGEPIRKIVGRPMNTHNSLDHQALQEENRSLRQELLTLRQFIDSLQNVMEVVESAPPETEVVELLEEILRNARNTINANDGSLLVLDEDTNELVFVISQGDLSQEHLHWRRIPPGEGIAGWVAKNRRAAIVNDPQSDDRFYGEFDEQLRFHTSSVLAAPLVGAGRTLGVIELINKNDGALFSTGDQTLLSLICRFAGELLYTMIRDNEGKADVREPAASG